MSNARCSKCPYFRLGKSDPTVSPDCDGNSFTFVGERDANYRANHKSNCSNAFCQCVSLVSNLLAVCIQDGLPPTIAVSPTSICPSRTNVARDLADRLPVQP